MHMHVHTCVCALVRPCVSMHTHTHTHTHTQAMGKAAKSFDLILDTVSADHEIMPYIGTLKTDGKHVLIGLTGKPMSIAGLCCAFSVKRDLRVLQK